jgi:hypothetical protein
MPAMEKKVFAVKSEYVSLFTRIFFMGLPAGVSSWLIGGFAALSSPRGRTIFPASSTDLDCEQIFLKSMSYDSVSENRFLVA